MRISIFLIASWLCVLLAFSCCFVSSKEANIIDDDGANAAEEMASKAKAPKPATLNTTTEAEKQHETIEEIKLSPNAPNVDVPKQLLEKRRLKILIYSPTLGWSHMQFMGAVADTLADAGHEVHLLRFVMNERFTAAEESRNAHRIHQIVPTEEMLAKMDVSSNLPVLSDQFAGNGFPKFLFPTNIMDEFHKITTAICSVLVQNTALLDQLEAEHFDVAISEMYDLCVFAVFHRIRVHTQLSAIASPLMQHVAKHFGMPIFASYVTNMMAPLQSAPSMGFLDRATNFLNVVYEYFYTSEVSVRLQQPIVQQAFGNDFPDLRQIARNVSLVFTNTNPFFELPRPISHKVITVGGLVTMAPGPLSEELDAVLNRAEAGAILVSFGSVTDTKRMDARVMLTFLEAFAQFPDYEFIWKFEIRDPQTAQVFASVAPNVHAVDWFDQKTLLLHPKIRAFITHCGQNSLSEAARAGVPMLAIPLFGDQLYNAIVGRTKRMAILLEVGELHADGADKRVVDRLKELLYNPEYRRNAHLVAKKHALTPFSARERLVRWVEFAAEFPELNELNLPWSEELGLFAYYSVDVMLALAAVLAVALAAILLLIRSIFCAIWPLKINGNGKANGNISAGGVTRRILQKSEKLKRF